MKFRFSRGGVRGDAIKIGSFDDALPEFEKEYGPKEGKIIWQDVSGEIDHKHKLEEIGEGDAYNVGHGKGGKRRSY